MNKKKFSNSVTKTLQEWSDLAQSMNSTIDFNVNDKLTYCFKKNITTIGATLKTEWTSKLEDINASYAVTNKDGEFKTNEKGDFIFLKEQHSERKESIEDLRRTEVEINLYMLTDENNPRVLAWDQFTRELFKDVLPDSYLEESFQPEPSLVEVVKS